MYRAMKRHSLLAVLPRLILSLALAAALLACTAASVGRLIAGPKNLNTLGTQARAGDFVTVDMSQLINGYASISRGEKMTSSYYVLKLSEGTYLSLHAEGGDMKPLERATNQAYDYYMNNSGILNPMGMISGQLEPLDEDNIEGMRTWLTGSSIEGFDGAEITGTIIPLDLHLNHLGGLRFGWIWLLFVLGLACLAWFAVELILVLTGHYYREVRQLNPDEQEWREGKPHGNAHISRSYVFYTKGAYTHAFDLHSVVWVYKQFNSRVIGKYKWPVSVFTEDGGYYELCTAEDSQRDRLIDLLREHGGRFVRGYSEENYEQFTEDFEGFCQRAREE